MTKIQGALILEARKRLDMSQLTLALRMHTPVQYVSEWEHDLGYVSGDRLRRLCGVLGVTEAMLAGVEPFPEAVPPVRATLDPEVAKEREAYLERVRARAGEAAGGLVS